VGDGVGSSLSTPRPPAVHAVTAGHRARRPRLGAGIQPLPPGGSNWVYNDRPKVVPGVFAELAPVLKPGAIATDGEASYPKWINQQDAVLMPSTTFHFQC